MSRNCRKSPPLASFPLGYCRDKIVANAVDVKNIAKFQFIFEPLLVFAFQHSFVCSEIAAADFVLYRSAVLLSSALVRLSKR